VVIHVHNNQADTTFISDNSDVRRALHDGLSNLKDMLGQSGINLGQANINSSQQEQQSRQSSRDAKSNSQSGFTATEVDSKPMRVAQVSNGLVDTFA
jgi:flagellar hook-length control protein FliK